jgi:UDP-glucose 4-epimerase
MTDTMPDVESRERALRGERVLVTGGAGFIGSHLVRALLERGAEVRVLDNFATGRRENLAGVAGDIELIEGDLRDADACAGACRSVGAILHQGALPSVARSVEEPEASHAVNATGTLTLIQAARAAGVRRMVYAGSSSAYGDSETLPKRESMPTRPRSPYAASKLAGEHYVQLASSLWDMHTVVLRYFNVFGPRQDPTSEYSAVIPKFITRMKRGSAPTIYGDGLQSRDFTYIENVVRANLLAATSDPACAGNVYNAACGDRVTLLDLVAAINQALGTDLVPGHAAPRPGDVRHSQADIERARRELGYEPAVGFVEGLRRTIAAY